MNIITEPHVHLLAEPLFHPHPDYEIPEWKTAAEAITAHAGKGCYDSYGKDGRSIYDHVMGLITSMHGSVLEHANFTVFITGVSRGLSHEFVRHRAGFAYSQRSTRYTAEGLGSIVLSPYMASFYKTYRASLHGSPEFDMLDAFINQCREAFQAYADMVNRLTALNPEELEGIHLRKWARGQARQLLPHALETRLTVTGNIRAWRFFFEQRSSRWAEDEIRRLAVYIWKAIAPAMGCTVSDYASEIVRGWGEYTTSNRKV